VTQPAMDSGILMIQDSILVCSPDPRIPPTAGGGVMVKVEGEKCAAQRQHRGSTEAAQRGLWLQKNRTERVLITKLSRIKNVDHPFTELKQ
jgi:hypothetical protein